MNTEIRKLRKPRPYEVPQATFDAGKVKPLKLPARSPNLNAFAERWVRSL